MRFLRYIRDALRRAKLEYKYFSKPKWTLNEVGEFWDSVPDYDHINETMYPYLRRFSNSWILAKRYIGAYLMMLDIQSRTGKGTEFWSEKGVVKKSYLLDYSDRLIDIAKNRLDALDLDYEISKIDKYELPFSDSMFDLVVSYETIEHVSNRALFIKELARVMKKDGIMILTCPNALWEPVHWISAIIGFNHSEGPHRFPKRSTLTKIFSHNKLAIEEENTTIVLPFNNNISIRLDQYLEKYCPNFFLRAIGLRRTFVLSKMV